jgi:hypothetical protein
VVNRLVMVNVNHAEHAWQLRHRFGIAATGVVFLYADPAAHRGWGVRVAGKLFPDTPQVADTGRVLFEVCGQARRILTAGGDVRTQLCENPDPMSQAAVPVGVAVSMLDTPAGLWRDVRNQTTGGGPNVAGRVLALLSDDTMLLVDRFERHHPEYLWVQSTGPLEPSFGVLGRRWRLAAELARVDDPATRPVWLRLAELRAVVTGTEQRGAQGGAEHGR